MSGIVFVDSRVQDPQALLAGLGPDVQVVMLDAGSDGIAQIALALQGQTGLDSIQILSHGSAGTLYLGSTVLTGANLDLYREQLAAIGGALSADGDLLLYGCDVAAGDAGRAFIESLALLTGADVAASTDPTGSAALGGDWELEATTGTIETDGVLTAAVHDDYQFLLPATPVPTLLSLSGSNGFYINGVATGDYSGWATSDAGDVNGDGFGDVIIGAFKADPNGSSSGSSYVVFGNSSGFGGTINLSSLNGANGFKLNGEAANDNSGRAVSAAGDVNGDGIGDLIIGAHGADPNGVGYSGASYLLFGKTSAFASSINLSSLDGASGIRLNGAAASESSGRSVSSAGDINGDGYDDLIVGAPYSGSGNAGASYVVFGGTSGYLDTLHGASGFNLASLNGTNGFKISGSATGQKSGWSVSGAGDVNGDGLDDLLVGAHGDNYSYYGGSAGAAYVVYGKASGFGSSVSVSALDGSNGIKIRGEVIGDYAGWSVSGAGDVDGDGYDDIVIGARGVDTNGATAGSFQGAGYVVFGDSTSNLDTLHGASGFSLTAVNGSNGFQINGVANGDIAGWSVSNAGDVNGDGFDDLLIGAFGVDVNFGGDSYTYTNAGAAYVVYGKGAFGASLNLSSLSSTTSGFRLAGFWYDYQTGKSVSAAGDVNGDGFDDLLVGAPYVDFPTDKGQSYVVFGGDFRGVVTIAGNSSDNVINETTLTGGGAGIFISGLGNDTITGLGGADIFRAGAGDDRVVVPDDLFADVDGGSGTDTLALTGSTSLDLTAFANSRVSGIEVLDLTSGNHAITLALRDLYDLSDTGNTLRVEGDSLDSVTLEDVVTKARITNAGYNLFPQGSATFKVDSDIPVTLNGSDSQAETLVGNATADTIYGGGGDDTLTGNGGNDVFSFDSVGGVDRVTDFNDGDLLRVTGLSALQPITGGTGSTIVQNEMQLFASGGVTTLYVGLNSLPGADLTLQLTGTFTTQGLRAVGTDITVNHAPVLANLVADQNATEDSVFNFVVPSNTFSDADGETLTYSATKSDGSLLPAWLNFTPGSRTFSGTPADSDVGPLAVRVTATDGSAASVLDTFNVTVANTNDAPTVSNPIGAQSAPINYAFNFVVPANTFSDVDLDSGDVLTYTAKKNDDTNLPAWLQFDPVTRTFSGTPSSADLGTLNVKVTATDLISAAVSNTFTLNVPTVLTGTGGADTLDGGPGAQTMTGGNGNDAYIADDSFDVVVELNVADSGTDYVYASVNYVLPNNSLGPSYVENLTLTGNASIDGTGNFLPNILTGNSADNQLDGGGGDDLMVGGTGDDVYIVDAVGDQVEEGAGQGNDSVESGVTYSLAPPARAHVEHLMLTGGDPINATGNGQPNLLTGNTGNNVLDGRASNDTLIGGDGNDSLAGGADADTLIGGNGNDTLDGGAGADSMVGGAGDDYYYVDDLGDTVLETSSSDGYDRVISTVAWTLGANVEELALAGTANIDGTGNSLSNWLIGNTGNNVLTGLGGDDFLKGAEVLNGSGGTDTLMGGSGNDTYYIDSTDDFVDESGADPADRIYTTVSITLPNNIEQVTVFDVFALFLVGNGLSNYFRGNDTVAGNDFFSGAGGNDTMEGVGGNDTLNGESGSDSMVGGSGSDTYFVDDPGDVVVETSNTPGGLLLPGGGGGGFKPGLLGGVLDSITDTVIASINFSLAGLAYFERLVLIASATVATGNSLANELEGNAQFNQLFGLDGNDTLDGAGGNDTLDGGAGIDTVSFASVTSSVQVALALGAATDGLGGLDTIVGAENVSGSAFNDTLAGDSSANLLAGAAGNDLLDGGDGNDTLHGGSGLDSLVGADGNDVYQVGVTGVASGSRILFLPDAIVEAAGQGADTVFSDASFTLAAQVENLVLNGAPSWRPYTGTGNDLDNMITGAGAARHRLFGAGGNDTLDGGAGADQLDGGSGDDVLVYDAADTSINGGTGTDTLRIDGSGVTLDLNALADGIIKNVEVIDLTGSGNNALALQSLEILALAPSGNTLRVDGNSGDSVLVTDVGGWTQIGDQAIGANTYHRWTDSTFTLLLDNDVSTNLPIA